MIDINIGLIEGIIILQISMEQFQALQSENVLLKQELLDTKHLEKILKQKLEQYEAAYDRLQQQVQDLLRHRFGQRSERDVDANCPQLDFLVDEKALPSGVAMTSGSETIEVHTHQRRKKAQKNRAHYIHVIETIPVAEADKVCACGCTKAVIRYETKELFDYEPAVLRLIEQRREVVACPKGCTTPKTADAPLQVLPKTKATANLLAHLVISKFHDRQPLYHLEKYGRSLDISRETMARWLIQLVLPLQPLFNLLKDQVIEYDIASLDATTLQVLDEPGRAAQTKSYVYCLRGGPPEKSVILYSYNAQSHKQFVADWLTGFRGKLHVDASDIFQTLFSAAEIEASYCHAHARRYFEKIKKRAKKPGLSHEALRYYKKLYQIERTAKDQEMTAMQRQQLRQAESKPILDEFYEWLKAHAPLVLPQSDLGKAFAYVIQHEAGLRCFLTDGRLEIDNNLTEQEIKPLVIARKNFMFAQSVAGAHAICLHLSLIRTALLNHLNPYDYYVAILKRIPYCKTVEDYEALLPWHIKLD